MNWKNFLKPSLFKILVIVIGTLPITLGGYGISSEPYVFVHGFFTLFLLLPILPIFFLLDLFSEFISSMQFYHPGVWRWLFILFSLVYYYIFACLAVFIFEKISGKIGKKQTILILITIGIIAGGVYGYFCYEMNKPVEQRTVEKCEKIKERDSRNECYFNIAQSWLAECDKVQEEHKDDCYKIKARALCEAIREQDQKDDCYKIMAEISKQSSICESIIDTQIKEKCYQSVRIEKEQIIDETADWNVYQNEYSYKEDYWGYEIKYPPNWIMTEYKDVHQAKWTTPRNMTLPLRKIFIETNGAFRHGGFYIDTINCTWSERQKEWFEKYPETESKTYPFPIGKEKIGELEFCKMQDTGGDEIGKIGGLGIRYVIFKNGWDYRNTLWVYYDISEDYQLSEGEFRYELDVFKKMLSTFKFIEE